MDIGKKLIVQLLITALYLISLTVNASDVLAFGGITFQGGAKELPILYPYSASIVKTDKVSRTIFRQLLKTPPKNFSISPQLLDKDEGHRYAFSLMIDNENVSVEKLSMTGNIRYKVVVYLSAQIVMFDVTRSQFLASIPLIPIQRTETLVNPPSESELKAFVRKLVGSIPTANDDIDSNESLVPRFIKLITSAKSPTKANLTQIAVNTIEIQDKALHALPDYYKKNKNGALKRFIAQQITKNLSVNQQVATQPYVVDASVLTMQGRFTGGDETYTLTLPEPAYVVDFILRGFKKIETSQKAGVVANYATFSHFQLRENTSDKKLVFAQRIKNGGIKVIPRLQTLVDDWAAFRESLLGLLNKSTTTLHDTRSSFYKAQKYPKKTKKQLISLEKVYKQCKV